MSSSGKSGSKRVGSAPTGRTTSPPAPVQRSQTRPQPATGGANAAGGVPRSTAAAAAAAESSLLGRVRGSDRHRDPQRHVLRQHVPQQPRNVELAMHQMITNAATKEQYESGCEEPPPAISCIAFDTTGDYMAYGDRAGRCYVFQRNRDASDSSPTSGYTLLDVVEAYVPQLDTLNSTEIEAKVNVMKFVDMGNGSLFFLTANDKCIKMWKIWDRIRATPQGEYEPINALLEDWTHLDFPQVQQGKKTTWHKELKQFAADHEYHINSLSVSSNKENFVSADDLTVQLWHLHHPEQSQRILDRRPANMEELSETITSATYHSTHPQELYVANSRGVVSCYDLRENLNCAAPCNNLMSSPAQGPDIHLQSILAGISDMKSSPCGTYIIARDYLSVKVWDVRKGSNPVKETHVHDDVYPRLTELYEHDYLFDRFEVVTNHSGSEIYTGSYRGEFVQFDSQQGSKLYTTNTNPEVQPVLTDPAGRGAVVRGEPYSDSDFQNKVLNIAAHPQEDVLAVGCGHELFLYSA